jgi:hypothetical protein
LWENGANPMTTKTMNVTDLIEHLKTFDRDLPVWLTISDDVESCYQKINRDDITIEEVCTWKEEEEQEHFPALVIGHRRFFP